MKILKLKNTMTEITQWGMQNGENGGKNQWPQSQNNRNYPIWTTEGKQAEKKRISRASGICATVRKTTMLTLMSLKLEKRRERRLGWKKSWRKK